MRTHLVEILTKMAVSVPKPRLGEWDVPTLLADAADEIVKLRKYALALEATAPYTLIQLHRQFTEVNWEAIHGVDP